jgi:polysaccharide pyruvyl transferase WcaK-like protein
MKDISSQLTLGSVNAKMRVVMCGPALNYSNAGDRLLPKMLGQMLRDNGLASEICYVSVAADPRVRIEAPWLRIISPRSDPIRVLWKAFRADVFAIAGAIPFHDHRLTMFKQAVLAWVCRIGGGRVVVNAASIQPMRDRLCRILVRVTYAAANWFTVRDDVSVVNAKSLGIKHEIPRSPDPGIMATPCSHDRIEQIWAGEGLPKKGCIIGIAPHFFANLSKYRHEAYTSFDNEYQLYSDHVLDQYYQALAETADRLAEFGTIVFVPLCTATPPGDDRQAADWIRARMRNAKRSCSVKGEYTVDEVCGILSRCNVLIASRLHGYALSVATGVPSLAVEFHPKMRGLAEELDLVDWVYPFKDIPVEDICLCVNWILEHHDSARQRVLKGVTRAARRAKEDFLEGVTGRRKA